MEHPANAPSAAASAVDVTLGKASCICKVSMSVSAPLQEDAKVKDLLFKVAPTRTINNLPQ
eukprot:1622405-Amphidinium_carterae.1